MKRSNFPIGCTLVVGLFITALSTGIFLLRSNYYQEYNNFRNAIESEGFSVKSQWLYDEDFTLEDFGFFIAKDDLSFWIDIRLLSNVRAPDEPIDGLIIQSLHEDWKNNTRVIEFKSDDWKHKFSETQTPRNFLAKAHELFPMVLESKAIIPKVPDAYPNSKYKDYLIIRDDTNVVSPLVPQLIEHLEK